MSIQYPTIDVESLDEETLPFGLATNWQNETIAKTHAMVFEMYQLFEKLKPLVDSMPPMGMAGFNPLAVGLPPGVKLPGRR